MPAIEVSQQIAASPDVVFALATSLREWPNFIEGIDKVEVLTDGPMDVGTRFVETRTFFGKEATEEMTVVEFSPPNHYATEANSHGSKYESSYEFEENDGGTRVTMHFKGTPETVLAKVLSFMMMPIMKRSLIACVQTDLGDIKKAAEKDQGST